MNLAIMQPYFLPYIGYFQLMSAVDRFVILDDVSFIKGGWTNRNRIRSFGKTKWLTIPVAGASPNKMICDLDPQIDDRFVSKTLRSIEGAYQKSVNYAAGAELFEEIIRYPFCSFADFTRNSLLAVVAYLGIECEVKPSSRSYGNNHLKGEDRVLDICQRENAKVFVNPPGGKEIYQKQRFLDQGMDIKFVDPQLKEYGTDFVPAMSILDVIMNTSREQAIELAHDFVLTD